MDNKDNKDKSPRRRARTPKGHYKGDNTATPGLNEAWEPTDIAEVVSEKEVKYTVKPKVGGTSNPTAGKYSKKGKVRPSFGNITTTFH